MIHRQSIISFAAVLVLANGCGASQADLGLDAVDQQTRQADLKIWPPGVVDPPNLHQRYRRSEYPADETFYQWWFFTVRDNETNQSFAFAYSMLDAVAKLDRESARIMFAMVAPKDSTAFFKAEVFPLPAFEVKNDFDLKVTEAHGIEVLADGVYRIHGKMQAPVAQVVVEGTWSGQPVAPAVPIEWDLTIRRIYGWYGQDALEGMAKKSHGISWNTYAHTSEVEGFVRVDGREYRVERSPRFRAYCDMNWGTEFPQGRPEENPLDYPWGWYSVGRPSADRSQEIGIIVGTGKQHLEGQPRIEGKFADLRLGAQKRISIASVKTFKDDGTPATGDLGSTTDGVLLHFDVDRSEWATFTDSRGSALIPLRQTVRLETARHRAVLDFHSTLDEYNRLPFLHEKYLFSDFEALGVDVHVIIERRGLKGWTTLYDFWSDDGGLEYGYRVGEE